MYRSMEDLSLDSPHAYQILESFCNDCLAEEVISDDLREKMPGRLVQCILVKMYSNCMQSVSLNGEVSYHIFGACLLL